MTGNTGEGDNFGHRILLRALLTVAPPLITRYLHVTALECVVDIEDSAQIGCHPAWGGVSKIRKVWAGFFMAIAIDGDGIHQTPLCWSFFVFLSFCPFVFLSFFHHQCDRCLGIFS